MARFTTKFLEGLRPEAKEYFKAEGGTGLHARVYPTGRVALVYIYTSPLDSRRWRRKILLGDYKKAGGTPGITLKKARERMKEPADLLDEGKDPLEEKARAKAERIQAPTVKELAEEYLNTWAKRNRKSWREDERILNKYVLSEWGKKKAMDIFSRDVRLLIESVAKRGPTMSNRVRSLLHIMYRVGVEQEAVPSNPVAKVPRLFKEKDRDRHLPEEELSIFWHGLDETGASDEVKRALQFILATAARPGEVVGLMWEEVDPSGEWWNLPAAKAKNGKALRIHLNTVARELMGERPEGGGPVFASPAIEGQALAVRSLSRVVRRAEYFGLERFTPHDLRRSAATHMPRLGTPHFIVGQLLGHTVRSVTGVYDRHSYDPEKKKASEKWGRELKTITTGKAAEKVIQIR